MGMAYNRVGSVSTVYGINDYIYNEQPKIKATRKICKCKAYQSCYKCNMENKRKRNDSKRW